MQNLKNMDFYNPRDTFPDKPPQWRLGHYSQDFLGMQI
jgi:hypothetical protein